jgi:hypothetical protein
MMTNDDDAQIDARVARAADRPVDIGRLQSRVRQRISGAQQGDLFSWMKGPARLVPAAFAIVLVATPFALQNMNVSLENDLIWSLATGEGALADLEVGG